MDRSLDEIISEGTSRPRGGASRRGGGGGGGGGGGRRAPQSRGARRDDQPRDGVRKFRRDERNDIDADWVHDRFEDDRFDKRPSPGLDRHDARGLAQTDLTRVRVDNLHYDLNEMDLRDLFGRTGPLTSVRLLYDRADRSQGTAYVTFEYPEDAYQAVSDYDGCNAHGQPIRLTLVRDAPALRPKPLLERVERPRSLLDRVQESANGRDHGRREGRRGGLRGRSLSPQASGRARPDIDRYQPGRGSRSPIRRRGTPREGGRRPGQRRDENARGPRRPRTDDEGRLLVNGRPKKTADELDAEMEDYWVNKNNAAAATNNGATNGTAANGADNDMVMDDIE